MNRHELRERLFKLLFRIEFNTPEEMPEQIRYFCEDDDNGTTEKEDSDYVTGKYEKIIERKDEIDSIIDANASGWDITRLGKVELAVMRLAVYELCFDDDIPTGVAMNEAVELAKRFGQENSGAFVNAVLSKIKTARGIE
ncbi:MAG: transcription antitermination factor NusB [Lachnospiraceae bacterium]|nr:transcription antitermination factor NusB [Lachnospiraceae bacterium]